MKCFSGGPLNPIGIKPISSTIPKEFKLYQNYPNPFNPGTTIKFDIPNKGVQPLVKIVVYDIIGREVAVLFNDKLSPGTYTFKWSADAVASGVYFYKLTAGDFSDVKKLILLK
ncbi:MAG: T9SS type A sorting domain-containing protein [Ignavibacteria bacterium]